MTGVLTTGRSERSVQSAPISQGHLHPCAAGSRNSTPSRPRSPPCLTSVRAALVVFRRDAEVAHLGEEFVVREGGPFALAARALRLFHRVEAAAELARAHDAHARAPDVVAQSLVGGDDDERAPLALGVNHLLDALVGARPALG